MQYKVHIEDSNLMPTPQGQGKWPRREFLYWTDDGNVAGLYCDRWKRVFMEKRTDQDGICHKTSRFERVFLLAPDLVYVKNWLTGFEEFPPRQKPRSFNLSDAEDNVSAGGG